MKTKYHGMGVLQLNHGIDMPRSTMTISAETCWSDAKRGVRLTVKDPLPGGCAMMVMLSPAEAHDLAMEILALSEGPASTARETTASEYPSDTTWLAMTA